MKRKLIIYKNHKIDLQHQGHEDSLLSSIAEEVMQITGLELVIDEKVLFLKLIAEKNYPDTLSLISNVAFIELDHARRRLKRFVLVFGMCCIAKCKHIDSCWDVLDELADAISGIDAPYEKEISALDILEMFKDEGIKEVIIDEAIANSEVNLFTEKTQLSRQYLIGKFEFIILGTCKN